MNEQIKKHSEILSIFNTMFDHKILTAFAGPIDSDILTLLAENLEGNLWENACLGRKFFRIFIELSQNIALYSHERITIKGKDSGSGIFLISDLSEYFLFSAGNLVNSTDKLKLLERIHQINSFDRLQLREYKRKLRKLGNNKGGGNIGLIQVALLSKFPIEFNFFETDDEKMHFFIVSVKLQKL